MKICHGLVAGMLALGVLASFPANAQRMTFKRSGDWEAYGGVASTQKPYCGVMQKSWDRSLSVHLYRGDSTFTISIINRAWALKEGDTHALSFTMVSGSPWETKKADVIKSSNGDWGLAAQIEDEQLDLFVREFRSGSQMQFKFPTVDPKGWTVSLTGSSDMTDVFDRCRRLLKTSGPSILGEPTQWCMNFGQPTPDQRIEGCNALMGSGLWADKEQAFLFDHRADGYAMKGDYEHAIADDDEILKRVPNSYVTLFTRGRNHFFRADFSLAAADFAKSLEMKPDPWVMMWRFMARSRTGQNGTAELAAATDKLEDKDWPYPVIEFYLGKLTAEEMQAAAPKPENKCEATYYLAQWQILHGNSAEAKPLLQTAVDTCPEAYIERDAARVELKRLGQ